MQGVLIFSGVYLFIVFLCTRNAAHAGVCAVFGFVLIGPILFLGNMFLGRFVLLTSAALLVAFFFTENKWHYRGVVALAALTVYGFFFREAWQHEQEMVEIRKALPVASMEERLSYERKPEPSDSVPLFSEEHLWQMALRIANSERNDMWRHRQALEELHSETANDFASSPGLGSARMPRTTKHSLLLPKDAPIPLPTSGAHPLSAEDFLRERTPLSVEQRDDLEAKAPKAQLWTLHHKGVVDFIEPSMLGIVKSRSQVLGFVPHHFQKMPALEEAQRWQVTTLELVSILKHEEPVAYVSRHLPRMSELHKAKTRPLTAFEKLGLDHLKKGEDLHVDYAPEMIRMVGSLRAANVCLDCHSAQRGQLLGAFVYRLEVAAGK